MSSEEKNRLTVVIYGKPYHMVGRDSIAHMKKVARHVHEKMMDLADGNPRLDTTKLAVLSALNIADEYLKLKQEYDELVQLIEEDRK